MTDLQTAAAEALTRTMAAGLAAARAAQALTAAGSPDAAALATKAAGRFSQAATHAAEATTTAAGPMLMGMDIAFIYINCRAAEERIGRALEIIEQVYTAAPMRRPRQRLINLAAGAADTALQMARLAAIKARQLTEAAEAAYRAEEAAQ